LQTNVIGWVDKNKKNFLSSNLLADERFSKDLFMDSPVGSVMCVPLKSEGSVIGYFVVMNEAGNRVFTEKDLSFLEKLSFVVAPYLSNIQKVSEYFEAPLPDSALFVKYERLGLLGRSKKFKDLLKSIEAAARCDVRVLLEGQSGTGKELIAKAIHQLSSRKDFPFVAVDCGAIPEQLIESELFGHVKGSFTGASQDRKGLFEEAHLGTLFMDEISNLPFDMQAKLLRVLQEGEIRILGSNQNVIVNVRVIAASSPSLRDLVDEQKFREDLYYRLHVYPIHIPTLGERKDDITLLADHFLKKFSFTQNKDINSFHPEIQRYFEKRKWEGNIRELENFIERLVTLSPANKIIIDSKIIPREFKNEYKKLKSHIVVESVTKTLKQSIETYEKEIILQALNENNWNQSRAARILGISERTIRYKMEKLSIEKP
jgi:transcriptional regulator with GAF, ATPase, and Fis domain